jgi:hypothetical protein
MNRIASIDLRRVVPFKRMPTPDREALLLRMERDLVAGVLNGDLKLNCEESVVDFLWRKPHNYPHAEIRDCMTDALYEARQTLVGIEISLPQIDQDI